MSPQFPDGEGPIDRKAAKEQARKLLDDPKHKRAKGDPDDLATRDASLKDPMHQMPN